MRKVLGLLLILLCCGLAETRLGRWYVVVNDNSPYAAVSGDKTLSRLPKDAVVRLIKNETIAETIVIFPLRVLKLMVTVEPRGNWLVEYNTENRGYMWDSDLQLSSRQNY
ncbi:MAG: hypothetical protein LBQ83_02565 [Candidatus Margulisbacteria bacterium]|jgi:hypothetical protein|nr:hypothetical protein [Candidatus Margulisiibacteriota bacterium]